MPTYTLLYIQMKAGIYIHIPFCLSRCIYCGFYSTTDLGWQEQYIDALIDEIHMRHDEVKGLNYEFSTIYIGGGTPSTLAAHEVCRILDEIAATFKCSPCETTIEVNPDDITIEYVAELKKAGVNRISMGVQTFNDSRLKFIHRRHSAREAEEAFGCIRQSGIENISIDLMFGFPNETLDDWKEDIDKALSLNPEHISAYSLMYEEGTALYKMMETSKVNQVDDDTYLEMYSLLIDTLEANGYEHYEISNFAKPGRQSIHNSSYWNDTPYIGIGAAAHSYYLHERSWNIADIRTYVSNIQHGIRPYESEKIDADTHYDDMITTALRTREGLDLRCLHPKYRKYATENAQESISNGLLVIADNHLRLTRKGLFVSDMVMSDLMKV